MNTAVLKVPRPFQDVYKVKTISQYVCKITKVLFAFLLPFSPKYTTKFSKKLHDVSWCHHLWDNVMCFLEFSKVRHWRGQ